MTEQQKGITALLIIFVALLAIIGLYQAAQPTDNRTKCIAIENDNRFGGVSYEDKDFYEKHCALHDLPHR